MTLFRAERRRLVKRRYTRLMLAIVIAVLATIAGAFVYNSHKIGPAERTAAEARRAQMVGLWQAQTDRDRAACEAAKQIGSADQRFPADLPCEKIRGPEADEIPIDQFLPYQFEFRKEFGSLIMIFGGLLGLLAFAVGASYVGAEWHTGGMMNLLLWRPRRIPVLLGKLGTLLGGVLAIGVVLGGLWTLAFWLIGKNDGVTGKMTSGAWQSFAISGGRAVGLALVLAAVGFGLASIGRHTALALGAAVAVVVVGEIGLRIALSLMRIELSNRFMLSTYALAWFNKTYKLEDWNVCQWTISECKPKVMIITWQDSAIVFSIGTALVLATAIWLMRRRDVT